MSFYPPHPSIAFSTLSKSLSPFDPLPPPPESELKLQYEHTIGCPTISPEFQNFVHVRFDQSQRVFFVTNPTTSEVSIFHIPQVQSIITFHNYAVLHRKVSPHVPIPGGLQTFAEAWNSPMGNITMTHRGKDGQWTIPDTVIDHDLLSFPHFNSLGHFFDPRLQEIGAYFPNSPAISNVFIYKAHVALYDRQLKEELNCRTGGDEDGDRWERESEVDGAPSLPPLPTCVRRRRTKI